MSKRVTLEVVKRWGESQGYTLLSTEYKNSKTPLSFLCPLGHSCLKSWDALSQGQGCRVCFYEAKRMTIEKVRLLAENRGITLLSKDYPGNSKSPMNFQCGKGHYFTMSAGHLQRGYGCRVCSYNDKRMTIEYIRGWVEDNTDFKLLSEGYPGKNNGPINLKCHEGHDFTVSWNNLLRGRGCPQCLYKTETHLGKLLAEKFIVNPQHWIPCPKEISKSGRIRVDFYLPETNTIVEYHGEQHYDWIQGWVHKTKKDFEKQQTRDQWLRGYCLDNSINYWEIPYMDFNKNSMELPNNTFLEAL